MSKNKKKNFLKIICLITLFLISSSAVGAGSAYIMIEQYTENTTPVTIGSPIVSGNVENTAAVAGEALTAAEIYSIAKEQVVAIKSTDTSQNVFGQETAAATSGSGFVISSDGYIMTNYHVIEYAAIYGYDLSVIFSDGTSYDADIVGYYEDNDLAIIKIEAEGLSAAQFGNSDSMLVGETVYCVGNPLGELDFTMTGGIVSALDRVIATDAYTSINMFQLDAAVNSGNSGGPVFDEYGRVIGIVTAKYSDEGVEGLGFAIPINDAVTISSDLISYGYVTGEASLGISVKDVESYVSQYYGIPTGAYVYSVTDGSCADEAGLAAGDVIVSADGSEVAGVDSLKNVLKNFSADDNITLEVFRNGAYITVDITLDEKTPGSGQSSTQQDQQTPGGSGYAPDPFIR